MFMSRQDWEAREAEHLASYAYKSAETRGRRHPEPEHPLRTVYQRDRDRIIHSTAFRRLEYKTQVFVNHEGDYYRTRLTHTLEVAQIARTAGRVLNLNVDLIEAVALAHDLGHTPFGHSGEDVLAEVMTDYGGFEHNVHGLRVVDVLEKRYPDFAGMNLSYEVRESMAKHRTRYDHPAPREFDPASPPLLEAQVVEAADSIAYNNHDLDDGLKAGIISEKDLADLRIWRQAVAAVEKRFAGIAPRELNWQAVIYIINAQVTDLLEETARRIEQTGVATPDDVRACPERIVGNSAALAELKSEMEVFLNERLYQHWRVERMADKARRYIKELFAHYLRNPKLLPDGQERQIETYGLHRAVCDYIAGMTDRFALDEYKRLFYPYERV